MSAKLTNITLSVSDVERSLRFYHAVFGLGDTGDSAPGMALLSAGAVTLLLQPHGASSAAPVAGGVELGFEVDNVAAVRERLAALGADMDPTQQMGWGEALDARDPDGHSLTVFRRRREGERRPDGEGARA